MAKKKVSIYRNNVNVFRNVMIFTFIIYILSFVFISITNLRKEIRHNLYTITTTKEDMFELHSIHLGLDITNMYDTLQLNDPNRLETLIEHYMESHSYINGIEINKLQDETPVFSNIENTIFETHYLEQMIKLDGYQIRYQLDSDYFLALDQETKEYEVAITNVEEQLQTGYSKTFWKEFRYSKILDLNGTNYLVTTSISQQSMNHLYFFTYFLPFMSTFVLIISLYAFFRYKLYKSNFIPIQDLVSDFKEFSELELDHFNDKAHVRYDVEEFNELYEYFKQFCQYNKINYDSLIKSLQLKLEAAEESSQSKSVYLANMSHEMRTPLNSIIGYAQLIEKIGYDDVNKVKAYVDHIHNSSNILLQKINDILDLAKIEANLFEMIKEPVQIRRVVKEVYDLLVLSANKKGINFFYRIDPQIPNYLLFDETRFKQILINLCSNAIKFTQEGYVKLDIELFGFINDSIVLDYKITDTGIGISNDHQDKIFLPFVQVGNKTHQGTGLGLTITKDLIKLMGGEINVTSKLGVGTIFSFTTIFEVVDVTVKDEQDDERTDEEILELIKDLKILVVEDNPINQLLITEVFHVFGKDDIDLADDGLEGINRCKETQYDMIFMDIQMPNCDGVEATQILRSWDSYRDTPIIALTANAFSEQVNEYLSLGMTDYLKKPLDIKSLKKVIHFRINKNVHKNE
jgi:signal transduction histidine kinase/CheY-like chemotaxis protein